MVKALALEGGSEQISQRQRCSLRIGGLTIEMLSDDCEIKLGVEGPTKKFLAASESADVSISVAAVDRFQKNNGRKVFDSGPCWQLYQDKVNYYFRFISSTFDSQTYKVAVFNKDFSSGQLSFHRAYFDTNRCIYPLEYPLDELLILNLLAMGKGAGIHACGILDSSGQGHLFVGASGAGKTTIARLWNSVPDVEILSDDRMLLRKEGGNIRIYGTPWHGETEFASPSEGVLSSIFFLRKGQENRLVPMTGAEAVARLFTCSFPPFYSRSGLEFTLNFFEEIIQAIPCYELYFLAGESVIEFITARTH